MLEDFYHFYSHEVHSYTVDMHVASREKRLARKAEGAEPDDNDEMDNFQDLQLGSMTPLVRLEDLGVTFLSTDSFWQDMKRIFEL